jgi:histidine triad (HIT) family protein
MYHHAPDQYRCPFCLIAQGIEDGKILSHQADVFYRGANLTALVPSHSWENNPGNAIIIPNSHYENIFDLPDDLLREIAVFSKRLAFAMKAAYGCPGISTRQHNEPAGNQDVWHYHLHVFPRFPDDQLYTSSRIFTPEDVRSHYAGLLRQALS